MPQVIHIPGGWPAPKGVLDRFDVGPGESIAEVLGRMGAEFRIEHKPYPTADELERAELEARVTELRQEYTSWADLPAPIHLSDECTECEALRIVEGMLD